MGAILSCLAMAAAMVLTPEAALAWGPGVHLMAGNFVLANLDLLPPALAALLSLHRDSFLYGSLSADIFLGRGSRLRPGHSHDWEVAFDLLERDPPDKSRAYALGYLAHLAADVVAHNFYVPNMLARTPSSGKLSHVYVEMQADRLTGWDSKQARALFRGANAEVDALLLSSTGKNRSLFLLRKAVFKRGLAISDMQEMRRFLASAGKALPRVGGKNTFAAMFDLTLRAMVDFLHRPDESPVLAYDPTGGRRLAQVKRVMRKKRRTGTFRSRNPLPGGPMFVPDPALADLPGLDEYVARAVIESG